MLLPFLKEEIIFFIHIGWNVGECEVKKKVPEEKVPSKKSNSK